jgi:hypothetical protein
MHAGKANGLQMAWINGKLALNDDNLMYRKSHAEEEKIGGLHFHVYHGGRGAEWAPNKNQFIWYAYTLHKPEHSQGCSIRRE